MASVRIAPSVSGAIVYRIVWRLVKPLGGVQLPVAPLLPFGVTGNMLDCYSSVPGSNPGGAAVRGVAPWGRTRLENVAIREGNGSTPLSPVCGMLAEWLKAARC
jgi:hypothetical protein